jgi:hypothetical protein
MPRTPVEAALSLAKRAYLLFRRPRPWSYPGRIQRPDEGNASIEDALTGGRPFCAGRFGSVELNCLERFLRNVPRHERYSQKLRSDLSNNAGVFPTDDDSLDAFSRVYAEAIQRMDAVGVWFNLYEDLAIRKLCPGARLVPLQCLEPYYFARPWSRVLAGKRVLVVHPFAGSIEASYAQSRTQLFQDPQVLPEFDLVTLKAVQSNAGARSGFASWFKALEWMKARISEIDFDVCIVGAGAYGLPLAAHAKSLGRQAIHMGGASQILFGIIGRRWEEHPVIHRFFNAAWRRPSRDETPTNARAVEDGCYW